MRPRHIGQPLNLAPINGNPGYFQQILACGLIAFPRGSPGSQTNQRRGKAVDQAQRLIQWGSALMVGLIVKVIAPKMDGAKDGIHLKWAVGMTFFANTAGVLWNVQSRGFKQRFKQAATILEQRLAQP